MTQEKHIVIWEDCLRIIENNIEPQQFATWFRPIKPVSLVESSLTVEVPSDFFREYLENAYLELIKATLKRTIGAEARLFFVIRPIEGQKPIVFESAKGLTPVNKTISVSTYKQPEDNPGPLVFPGLAPIRIETNLVPDFCFDNLVCGPCNKLAVSAGENISNDPGKAFNPLFVFGGPGVGKTHLAQAIGNAIKQRHPELIVLYVNGNEFKLQYMEATTVLNKLPEFLSFYMKIDVLIIDDIHDLLGQGSQRALFSIFNHFHQNGKQLVFTSDRAPVELRNFEERLLSRFKWGLSVELQKPDYKTRLEMLRIKSLSKGVALTEDVLEFLAGKVKSNFRELEGTLMSLIAHATILHQDIDIELAHKVTEHLVDESRDELSIERISNMVCHYFNISNEELVAKSRKRQIVQARQIAMYLCRNFLKNCSLAAIGAEIGGKDHATVLHSCSTVQDLIATDKIFRKYVTDLETMLSNSAN